MKITEVKTYNLKYPLVEPFANSHGWSTARSAGVVEIRTDAGITGWGEGSSIPSQSAIHAHLIGKDPSDIEVIWNAMHQHGGSNIAAISGVDIALWDIMGQAWDQPIYRLLGGAFRDRIPAYASGIFKKDKSDITQALMDEAKGYVDQGFPAVKMKIGFGEAYDVKNVAAVRKAIGDAILLAVDANCGYDVGTAIDVGQKISENDLFWYEEPITTDDVDGYVEIRHALKVRVAGGEGLRGRWAFRDLIQKRGLDIVQPDVSIAGGFTECRKIAAMASANYVRVLPHMWGGSIRLAATLHWQATIPDSPQVLNSIPSLFEFDMTENGLRTDLAKEPIRAVEGFVPVPQGPGLGIEINREVLEKYAC
ncbi:MAG: mandelate racemase/muconate lactonizing enzyme family protein [Candidatus Poribacteria bacterium]|nr:mandelate racemase/muconate lactonizing enzyme family protein [Candidatus Poribacteria bacterium]